MILFFFPVSCPQDLTVQYHPTNAKGLHRFSLQAFHFVDQPDPFVYIHCKVKSHSLSGDFLSLSTWPRGRCTPSLGYKSFLVLNCG